MAPHMSSSPAICCARERHNLTIRQGCSYLGRRTPCHARRTEFLEGQVALLMAYYNFLRPHRALKFGETRIPVDVQLIEVSDCPEFRTDLHQALRDGRPPSLGSLGT